MRQVLFILLALIAGVFAWQLGVTAAGPVLDNVVNTTSNSSAVQNQSLQDLPGKAAMIGLVWAPLMLVAGLGIALFAAILLREGGGGY